MTSEERKLWLKERQRGIGGTDIASICGVGFHDAAAVYAEKVAEEPADREPSNLMLMGLATEEMNAGIYSRKMGATLYAPGLVFSEHHPGICATFDRVELDTGRLPVRPVELKYVGPFFGDSWGDEGTDHVPDGYIVQVTWQGMILRHIHADILDVGAVSALAGSGEHRVYAVPYDGSLAEMLLELALLFWARVQNREGVEGWSHPLRDEIANRITSIRPETAVELGQDIADAATEYADAKLREKQAKEDADALKRTLLGSLGTNALGVLPDGRRLSQKVVQRKSYTVESSSYVDFRVHQPKKVKV